RLGGVPRALPRAARAAPTRVLGLLRGARGPAAAGARVRAPGALPEPLPLPGRGRLRAFPPARRDLAAPRLVRPLGGRAVRAAARRRRARLRQPPPPSTRPPRHS